MLEQRAQPAEHRGRGRGIRRPGELPADHEVGALAAADLVIDDSAHRRGVVVVAHVDVKVADDHRMPRQQPDRRRERDGLAFPHHEAADGRVVVERVESALPHLPERDERDHLGAVERDLGEEAHVDDIADEHVDGRFVLAVDHRERRRVRRGDERGKQSGHVESPVGPSAGASRCTHETTALGRSSYVETRGVRLGGGPPGARRRGHAAEL